MHALRWIGVAAVSLMLASGCSRKARTQQSANYGQGYPQQGYPQQGTGPYEPGPYDQDPNAPRP